MPSCQLRIRAWNPTGVAPGLRAVRLPSPPRTLGEHLLIARYERGLRQQDVAREIGVDEFTLLNWEKGKTAPVIRYLPGIYSWLGFCPVEPGPITLAERLLRRRTAQGLSQAEVARRLALDPGTVYRSEQGIGTPARRVATAIRALVGAK